MTQIISIINQKGGVGKTTVAINLASSLAYLGKRTLLIDADPQGNCTVGLGLDRYNLTLSLYEVLLGEIEPQEVIRPMALPKLNFLPSNPLLAGVDLELATKFKDKHYRLKTELDKIKRRYDYIIIDCPPGIGLNVNALSASDQVIIPSGCDYFSKEGLLEAFASVRRIKISFNPDIKIMGIVVNMFEKNKLAIEVEKKIRETYKSKVLKTKIPRSMKVFESQKNGQSLVELDPNSVAAQSFLSLAKEVVRNAK